MKVLMLSDFFLSGQTTHVLELARQLTRLEVEVHIAFGTIHSRLFYSHYSPILSASNVSHSQGGDLNYLHSTTKNWRPDIIHCQSSTLFKHTQNLSLRLGVPYILTCHGLGFQHPKYRPQFKLASAIVAIGPRVALELQDYMEKVTIIPNGIDTEHFVPHPESPSRRKKVIYMGRLEERRIRTLKQLALAHANITNLPLTIISDWNPNLPGTSFVPWQVDPVPHLQKAGIVVGCGRTAREALSCGNAVLLMQQSYDGVISPQLVACPDFDFSGNLGRFPLATLEGDLRRILRSNFRLKKLQSWGRNYAVTYLSSNDMAKKTLLLYKEVQGLSGSLARRSTKPLCSLANLAAQKR
mgnify:FL=1